MQYAPTITDWDFDNVQILTEDGVIRGVLEGKVDYADGKHGKIHMELELQNGSWKLRNFSLDQ